jgi:hypothetical protein
MRKRVEDPARPILVKLIEGEEFRLSPADQIKVASWAALKAMISEADETSLLKPHHLQRKRMKEKQPPPTLGWSVWIGYQANSRSRFTSFPFLALPHERFVRRVNPEATYFNSHVVTQVVGKLFIQTIHSPERSLSVRWRFSLPDRGVLFRIWPPTTTSIVWPPHPLTDAAVEAAISAVPSFLIKIMNRAARK